MPTNVVDKTRISNSLQSMTVSNAAVGLTGSEAVVLDVVDAEAFERATVQIRNEGEGATITAKVYGTLFGADVHGSVGGGRWVQIGDDITIADNSAAIKSIATTGLKFVGVKMSIASGSPTFNAGNCIMFLQGTI
tara:strand:- start:738 stop:1142 length:405 start_codon:yes stop_codon:yes gene_type:complete